MTEKVYTFKEFKKESEKRERKERRKAKLNETLNWMNNNKETLAVVVAAGGAILGGTTKIIKGVSKNVALKQEKTMKERFIYDRSLGRYIELKKPLTNSQLRSIIERKNDGEKLSSILQTMNLIR